MKKTAYFLLLLLLIGACGCRNRKTSYPPLIRQAEYWAEACPDSAIACLDSIDASLQELTEEERMYCHMLRIKAEDKLYIPHTSDSLINRIVRFYEQTQVVAQPIVEAQAEMRKLFALEIKVIRVRRTREITW